MSYACESNMLMDIIDDKVYSKYLRIINLINNEICIIQNQFEEFFIKVMHNQ